MAPFKQLLSKNVCSLSLFCIVNSFALLKSFGNLFYSLYCYHLLYSLQTNSTIRSANFQFSVVWFPIFFAYKMPSLAFAVIVCLLTNFVNMNNYPRQHWYYAPRNVYNSTDTYVTKSHISSIKLNFQWKILLVKHFWKIHFAFQTEPNQESKQTRIKYLK